MNNFGRFVPSNYLAPAAPLQVQTGVGWEYIRIINNSPYLFSVNFVGMGTIDFPEMFLEDIRINSSYRGVMIITPAANLLNIASTTSNLLTINGSVPGEIAHPQSQPLNLTAVNPTATGNPLFTAHWEWSSTAGNVQTLNIFNPATSGVDMIFHAGKIFSNTAGVPQALLTYITGADVNLSQAVSARPHIIQANAPASAAHCTAADDAGHGGTSIENARAPGSTSNGTIDLIAFPDTVTLKPGGNLLLVCSDTTSGHVISLILKWAEQVAVPAPNLGSVPILTAANIVNDNNNTGTGLIEASTAAGQETFVTNDGLWLLKVLQSGVLHQFLKTQASGNPLLLGQSGDTVEFLGTAQTDQDFHVNGSLFGTGGTVTIGDIAAITAGATSHNGSVSGTCIMYTPIWGSSLKILILVFHNYQSASSFTFSFPSSITNGVFMSGNYGAETVQFQLNGVAVASSIITVLAAAGGTSAGSNTIAKNSIGTLGDSAVNQALISSNASAVGQALVLIGV